MSASTEHPATTIMRLWLSQPSFSGCFFANWAATKDRMHLVVHTGDPEQRVGFAQDTLAFASALKLFAFIVYPGVKSELELLQLIEDVGRADRWDSQSHLDRHFRSVALHWTNDNGLRCSALGFAPLLSMPATRRAPFVALAVWPGGHDNAMRKNTAEAIGVGDMNHDLESEQYKKKFADTRNRVKSYREQLDLPPPQDYTLTFRLLKPGPWPQEFLDLFGSCPDLAEPDDPPPEPVHF